MGRGSRHSKNAGTMGSEAMSYAEIRTLGYGRSYERLGKESIGCFDDCQLTHQTAIDPVCTPWGIIYSREAIMTYLLRQIKKGKQKQDFLGKSTIKENQEKTKRNEQKAQIKLSKFNKIDQFGIEDNKNLNALTQANRRVFSNTCKWRSQY